MEKGKGTGRQRCQGESMRTPGTEQLVRESLECQQDLSLC